MRYRSGTSSRGLGRCIALHVRPNNGRDSEELFRSLKPDGVLFSLKYGREGTRSARFYTYYGEKEHTVWF